MLGSQAPSDPRPMKDVVAYEAYLHQARTGFHDQADHGNLPEDQLDPDRYPALKGWRVLKESPEKQ